MGTRDWDWSIIGVLTQGHRAMSRHIFGWGLLLAPGGWRPGMQLSIPQCTGRPPLQRTTWIQTSTEPRLRHHNLNMRMAIYLACLLEFHCMDFLVKMWCTQMTKYLTKMLKECESNKNKKQAPHPHQGPHPSRPHRPTRRQFLSAHSYFFRILEVLIQIVLYPLFWTVFILKIVAILPGDFHNT